MKIALNLAGLRSDTVGGARIYAQHLVEGIAEGGHDLTLFTTARLPPELALHRLDTINFGSFRYHEFKRVLYELHAIGSRVSRCGFDIVHSLGGYGIRVPSDGPPQVVTVYDLLAKQFPEYFSVARRIKRNFSFSVGDRYVEKYIAISNFTKQEIVKHAKVSEDRIAVVPLGSGSGEKRPVASPDRIGHIGSRAPYMIYPASFTPHKNHETLFAALRLLNIQGYEVPDLVLTGHGTDSTEARDLARSYGVEDRVTAFGWSDREVSLSLLANATMLVFPSKYEGFGLPVIEAMSLGVPAVVANAGSLHEVAGDYARFFDPDSAVQLAEAITSIMTCEADKRVDLGKAREWGDSYTWERCVTETLEIYGNVLNDFSAN